MTASRSTFFYQELSSLTASFKDNAFEFTFSSRHIKIGCLGGELTFVLTGADNSKSDGKIKPADGLVDFEGLEGNRIALKQVSGTITEVRVWAYK